MVNPARPVHVLIVEDNPGDVFLIKEGIQQQSQVPVNIAVSTDGEAAMEALLRERAQPDLILLDLNLPKLDGLEVLRRLKENEPPVHTPVLVLTSSKSMGDIRAAHELGVSGYVTKPDGFEEYMRMTKSICSQWIEPMQRARAEVRDK